MFVVNGLKGNLVSTQQFYGENHNVPFSKNEWNIYNYSRKGIMKGTRTSSICYGISTLIVRGCHKATLDDIDIWHQLHSHINFRDLSISKKELLQRLPNMHRVKIMVYEACQKGKQTKIQYKKTVDILALRPFELLHMNLKGQLNKDYW